MDQTTGKQRVPPRQSLWLFGLFTALGLAGNYLSYEVFFNIQFAFGSIFALLALQLLGLRLGIAAAFAISLITYPLWNHPYAIVIMTTEVAVVGLLQTRRQLGLVLADALYWLILGIPLVLIFYSGVMHLPFYNAAVTMMKQAINGIANALVARLIYMAIVARAKHPSFSLRELLFSLLVLAVLVPSLLLLAVQSRSDLARTEAAVHLALGLNVQRSKPIVDNWLRAHLNSVTHLAWMATMAPLPVMQQALDQTRRNDPDFLRIGLIDQTATTIAFSPLVDENGRSTIGKNFADRPFIPLLRQNRQPMLSEVEMARIGAPKPRVTTLAPVTGPAGGYAGFIAGILSLDRIQEMLALNTRSASLPELEFVLLDKDDQVIVSSRRGFKGMEPYRRPDGETVENSDGISLWLPPSAQNVSISKRWEKALFVTGCPIGGQAEWRLILEQPLAPFQKRLYERYATQLAWVFAILLMALVIAELVSRFVLGSLQELTAITTDLPAKISSGTDIDWPVSTIRETAALLNNFQAMAHRLTGNFQEIQAINVALEGLVAARTEKLQESEERFRTLFEKVQAAALVIDLEDGSILDANSAAVVFYGWSRDHLLRMTIFAINTGSTEEVRKTMTAVKDERCNHFLCQHRRADGSIRDVEVYCGPIRIGDRLVNYAIVHDITERREAEAQVRQLVQEQRIILDTLAVGVAYSRERRLIWTNPAFQQMFGYSPRECDNLAASELYARPEDYERVGREGYARMAAGESYAIEGPARRKDGRTFWLSLTGRAINPQTPEAGSIWMFEDISERNRAETSLKEKTSQLEQLSRDLERQVEAEIASRMKNEQLLIQQSKLAAMGEMLGAIAHQWRQPLNTLGLCIQNINEAYNHNELERDYLERTVRKSMHQIGHMSKTIDDFRNFFQPDKESTVFDSMVAVGQVLSLFAAQLTANDIVFRLTCHTHDKTFAATDEIIVCPEKTIAGYRNEFEHVILNLISNAKDAIIAARESNPSREPEQGLIAFDFYNRDGQVVIAMTDNGGGIPETILPRVFEPYYTTKEPAKGTGIGLYMSRIIIEDHMHGSLCAGNHGLGAVFTITLAQAKAGEP